MAILGAPSVSNVPGPKRLSAACLGPDISLFLAATPPAPDSVYYFLLLLLRSL